MIPALLVVDIQNEFFGCGDFARKTLIDSIAVLNDVIPTFARHGWPVVFVQDIEPDHREPGSLGFDIPGDLRIPEGALRIHKQYDNAFWKTPLEDELRKRDADVLLIAGWCAEFCILSTSRGAEERGFRSLLLKDAIATASETSLQFVLELCTHVTSCAFLTLFENDG